MSAKADPVHASLAEALVAAQAEMPAVEADAINPHVKSRFVSLGNLVAKTRPVLNKHGIAMTQFPSVDADGKPTLVTLLIHGPTGERLEYPAPLMLPKADPQGQGSAITYMRRYAWSAALGIVDQEDDDGNQAVKAHAANGAVEQDRPQTPAEAERMFGAIQSKGLTPTEFLTTLGMPLNRALTLEEARAVKAELALVEQPA
jgi:hypothetical protein